MKFAHLVLLLSLTSFFTLGCSKKESASPAHEATTSTARSHEHKAPHGGTAIVLGAEVYHLEIVRDAAAGKLSAFVLDGEMDNFIRLSALSFEVLATLGGVQQTLVFQAMGDPATGEKPGDTALFEVSSEWVKSAPTFDAVIRSIEIRGATFQNVSFNFPKGNEKN